MFEEKPAAEKPLPGVMWRDFLHEKQKTAMKDKNVGSLRGFTLVELLVVIAMIATLAAISVAAVFKFRERADIANAMNSLKQLQTANTTYASDHNGRYVPASGPGPDGTSVPWYDNEEYNFALTGDAGMINGGARVRDIPDSLLDPKVLRKKSTGYRSLAASYGYNVENMPAAGSPTAVRAFKMAQVNDPARTAVFMSSTSPEVTYAGRNAWTGSAASEGLTSSGVLAFRHDDRAGVVYYDGHAEAITRATIRKIDDDDNGGAANVFWNALAP